MDETVRKAGEIVDAWMDDDTNETELVARLSAAGLLASPTMIACAEAAVVYWAKYGHPGCFLSDEGVRVRDAGKVHAATLAKPARYVRDEKTPGCCCIKDSTTGKWMNGEEILARLNAAEGRP